MLRRLPLLLLLALVVALPFLARPKREAAAAAEVTLVVITPHNEAIRHEFARGFVRWYRERTGRTVALDWRVIGGTSEITRFLESEYVAAFRNHWTGQLGRPWSSDVETGFARARLLEDASALAKEARAAFLASEVSCGIDVFFGGSTYDFVREADAGRIVPTAVVREHPDWFREAVIPRTFAGEEYWDRDGRWVGNVLSSYGILYNRDSLRRLGLESPPRQWEDLADPRLAGEVALADPTKSSSMAKAFENVIQQAMQRRALELAVADPVQAVRDPAALEARAIREGWLAGLRTLQKIGANARYFTDSSQKPPIDVAQGDCAVGICIDFYGRAQAEVTEQRGPGGARLGFVTPRGGTVGSVDPIAVLRGAPHRAVAEAFIEYTLTMEGQKLWNFRPGADGGPEHYALRRLPVRRDFFAHEEWRALRSDPEANPYSEEEPLVYRPERTAHLFRELAFVIRVMVLDTHVELARAWRAIAAAPEPAKRRAMMELQTLADVSYERAAIDIKRALSSKDRTAELTLAKELGDIFRRNYAAAEALALSGVDGSAPGSSR